jgi:hypothetical protein
MLRGDVDVMYTASERPRRKMRLVKSRKDDPRESRVVKAVNK